MNKYLITFIDYRTDETVAEMYINAIDSGIAQELAESFNTPWSVSVDLAE